MRWKWDQFGSLRRRSDRRSLRAQGVGAEVAREWSAGFEQGRVADPKVVFHFTSVTALRSILAHGLRPSWTGVFGPGVYAGTIPDPGWWRAVIFGGLMNRPIRVPIYPVT